MIELDDKPKTSDLPRFVPAIFANGEDDDTAGILAAGCNEAVQFDARVYEPGENMYICGRQLFVPSGIFEVITQIKPRGFTRSLHFERCHFIQTVPLGIR